MEPCFRLFPASARPRGSGGASTALQLTGLAIAAAIGLYTMGLVLAPPPVPSFTPAPEEARVSSAAPALANGSQRISPPKRALASRGLEQGSTGGATPGARADQLVDRLADIRRGYDAAPLENDQTIRRILGQLRSLGQGAVPALRRFLSSGDDLAFDLVNAGGRPVDSRSLRLALLEMLGAMEGTEAAGALEAELVRTRSPGEIQAIARMLENRHPGKYRALAANRAYDMLQNLWAGEAMDADAAPLYQVLAEHGGIGVMADLEQSDGPWAFYRVVALTQAPEGSGIPGLISVWQEGGNSSLQQLATQLLAQSAGRNPQAAQAFVEGLAEGKAQVPDHLWQDLGEALTGRRDLQLLKPDLGELPPEVDRSPYRTIQVGGPEEISTIYITEVENMSPDEQRARLEVVEQLLGEDLGPAAQRALEQARNFLKN